MDRKSQMFKTDEKLVESQPIFHQSTYNQLTLNQISHNYQPAFQLPPISEEQMFGISNSDSNLILDAVAGAGKTTFILYLAKIMQDMGKPDIFLLLTYNKKLKLETRKKIELLGLRNIEAHSYHSCAVKYYDRECYDDYKMIHVVNNLSNQLSVSQNKAMKLPPFTRIIIDEAQDMTELYYKFVCTIVRDIPGDKRLLKFAIIGDKFQSIFAFNGADRRFIQYADVLFAAFSGIPSWLPCKLSTSYRITRSMAGFINNIALKNDRLKAIKDGPPVEYIVCNTFGQFPSEIVYKVLTQSNQHGKRMYSNDDIFILAPSVKSMKSPVRKVANYLSHMKIPIFVPGSDEEPLDEDVLRGKVVFSTFHQVKGLERKIVFVFGFDASYFDFYAKNLSKETCPNTLYVAITRAIEQMFIFHHNGHDYLPFIDKDRLLKDCRSGSYVNLTIKEKIHTSSSKSVQTNINVADLTRHISAKVICDAMGFFNYKEILPIQHEIEIPIRVDGSNKDALTETVAEINGIALASYFEFVTTENMQILDELVKEYGRSGKLNEISGLLYEKPKTSDLKSVMKNLNRLSLHDESPPLDYSFNMTPENLLKLANQYCSYRTEYIYKLAQINKYDWLSEQHLALAIDRMKAHLSSNCNFEIEVDTIKPILGKHVNGRIDIFDKESNILWEIKAVKSLKFEHLIQTVIYGYLFQKMLDSKPEYQMKYLGVDEKTPVEKIIAKGEIKCRTFNILNGQILEVSFDPSAIEGMIDMIIYAKYFDGRTADDDEFVRELLHTQMEYSVPFDPNRVRSTPVLITKKIDQSDSKILEDDFVF